MEKRERLYAAKQALNGIAIGDCFGQTYFLEPATAAARIENRDILKEPWHFTDDTVMGIGVYRILENYEGINQEKLAAIFGRNYALDWHRGYGGTAHSILRALSEGENWKEVAPKAFDGMGSMGNGAAMRAAPIGAYFADDFEKVIQHAKASAEVTHSHLEGITGAVAAALGTAFLINKKSGSYFGEGAEFLLDIAKLLPESDTKSKIRLAATIKKSSTIEFVVSVLGNGSTVTAQDTVPFCLWCAAYFYQSLEEALWKAVSALGDRDTICAIVGGMVAGYDNSVPSSWMNYIEWPETSEFFQTAD